MWLTAEGEIGGLAVLLKRWSMNPWSRPGHSYQRWDVRTADPHVVSLPESYMVLATPLDILLYA